MPDWRTALAGLSSAYTTYRAYSRPLIQLHRDYNYVSKSRTPKAKSRSHKRKRKSTKMPRYRSKRSYGRSSKRSKRYSKRSRKSTRYSSKRKTPYKRVAARRYGSMYHAKRIKLNPGGFKSREIIRLQDSNTWTAAYPTIEHDGTIIVDPSHGGPLLPSIPITDGIASTPVPAAALGRCKQYYFRMNDLRNPWNQGKLVVNTPGPTAYNTWNEPVLAAPGDGSVKFNVLKPLPLTHYQTANFRGYTVIGSKYSFKLTNNESQPARKCWYAWRVTHVKPGTADQEFQFPASVQKDHPDGTPQTLQDLARTGRWSMGIVNSGSLDTFASRKVNINFSSNKLFGYIDGKPGAPNVTAKMVSTGPADDTKKDRTATSPASIALLQFIIGPCNIVDVSDPTSEQFGEPDPSFALQNVRVELKTSHYVALSDPVPLSSVNNLGPGYPV